MPFFLKKLLILAAVAVVLFGLSLLAQQMFPTKSNDPYGRRVSYRFLVYFLFMGALGVAALLGGIFG